MPCTRTGNPEGSLLLPSGTMMKDRTGAASRVRLIVYPGAHHGFDVVSLQPGREMFGHRVEYNETAAHQAIDEVRHFLAGQLGR